MNTTRMRSTGAAACVAITLALGCGGSEDDDMAPAYTTAPVSVGDGGADDGTDDDGAETDADDGDTGDDGGATDAADEGGDPGPAGTSGPPDGGDDTPPADSGPVDDGATGDPVDDGGPAAECLQQAANECETCACNTCLAELQACEQDAGCVAIRMCAQQNMCTGIGCLGPCGDVIDQHGGALGPSAGLARDLSECVEGGCPTC